ncbi:Na+/H+ antiporter [Terrimonas sp.]|uniref:Na+/H+ antiporter n=1 Tax=Terrimonas sp. TaxID=1914338 RepID=UPI000D51B3E9|nr:Na+/H+ antiporter [Terrimonas sp.]PVD53129.1 Na+/H+ antiporter [Terrimonas sp.]
MNHVELLSPENILLILSMLFVVALLTMLSNKLKISYPIFLVIAGLIISLIPGMPNMSIAPELVFLIFLPPLLYSAAWNTAWHEFWKMRRPISLLAFGLVIFTSSLIAMVSHIMIPDFPLAYGFLLGGIISPPDAIAATSVLQGLRIPKRVVTILEGESLINDASSLIVFSFALTAITKGDFVFLDAAKNFFYVVLVGILTGVAIANILYFLHRYLPTTPAIDACITLISPYIMYIVGEHFKASGVLAVVSGGLFLSYRSQDIFSYDSRLNVYSLWDTITFMLNGIVFILIGLELPVIVKGLNGHSIQEAVFYAVIISIVTIVVRLVWIFPGAYFPRVLFKSIRKKEPVPGWRSVFLVGWSGMRGVVSLAAALSIPLMLGGHSFPHRNLILFITFVVILFTLVLQGLSLTPIVRWLKIESNDQESQKVQAVALRIHLAESVLSYIDTNYSEETNTNETYKRVRDRYERMVEVAKRKLEKEEADEAETNFLPKYRQMLIELVHIRRRELNLFRHTGEYSEELIRERERELDLEEARLET